MEIGVGVANAELIERAYAAGKVDPTLRGFWGEIRDELGVPGLGLAPTDIPFDRWNYMAKSRIKPLIPNATPWEKGSPATASEKIRIDKERNKKKNKRKQEKKSRKQNRRR